MIDQGRIDEIRHLEFSRGFRGYEPREVDETLAKISEEMSELLTAYRTQQENLARAESLMGEVEKKEKLLSDTLVEARLLAQNTVDAARKEAEEIVRDADLSARQIISDAEERRLRAEEWFSSTREGWLFDLARIRKETGQMIQSLENLENQWNALTWPKQAVDPERGDSRSHEAD